MTQPTTMSAPPAPPIQTDLSSTITTSFLDNIFAHPTSMPFFHEHMFAQAQTRLVRTTTEFPINPSKVSLDGNERDGACLDHDPQCVEWTENWECVNNPRRMKYKCPASCNYCSTSVIH